MGSYYKITWGCNILHQKIHNRYHPSLTYIAHTYFLKWVHTKCLLFSKKCWCCYHIFYIHVWCSCHLQRIPDAPSFLVVNSWIQMAAGQRLCKKRPLFKSYMLSKCVNHSRKFYQKYQTLIWYISTWYARNNDTKGIMLLIGTE